MEDREEIIETPMGRFIAVFSGSGLKRLVLPRFSTGYTPAGRGMARRGGKDESVLSASINRYLAGEAVDFSCIPVDLSELKPFSQRVLLELRGVPYGEIVTYGELACMAGAPNSQRAVGRILGSNPVPLVIPCHRVVARNGIGGFSCGVEWKEWLLSLESGA